MSLESDIQTAFAANSTLVSTFTGGIFSFRDDLKNAGLTRTNKPTAFDANGILKPTIILKQRIRRTTPSIRDAHTQEASYVQALEVWFYDQWNANYSVLDTGSQLVYGLLHDRQINGATMIQREHHDDERDKPPMSAIVVYDVYDANGIVSP